tara:strand:+ start:10207 stop:10623 length:417 start_codon:yes stop_codon:yes gene_type:complete
MKSIGELAKEYLNNVSNPKKAASLFAEDGVIEIPYLKSLGLPFRTEGKNDVEIQIEKILSIAPQLEFINVRILMETHDQVLCEYEADTILANGRHMQQSYMTRFLFENGKIKLYREALDSIIAAKSIFPNGLADVPSI